MLERARSLSKSAQTQRQLPQAPDVTCETQVADQPNWQQLLIDAHTHKVTSGVSHPASPCALQQSPWQIPQSALHVRQVSFPSHTSSPHDGPHGGQSPGQFAHDSPFSHWRLPHTGHDPQSAVQVSHDSEPLQTSSPHVVHCPQSAAQLAHVSLPSQVPSPHSTDPHSPQSAVHPAQSSIGASQLPSPQIHSVQSAGQFVQFSANEQWLSPQLAH